MFNVITWSFACPSASPKMKIRNFTQWKIRGWLIIKKQNSKVKWMVFSSNLLCPVTTAVHIVLKATFSTFSSICVSSFTFTTDSKAVVHVAQSGKSFLSNLRAERARTFWRSYEPAKRKSTNQTIISSSHITRPRHISFVSLRASLRDMCTALRILKNSWFVSMRTKDLVTQ